VVASNVFPHVTYEGMVDIDKITDPVSTLHSFSDFLYLYKCSCFTKNAEGATASYTKSNILFWTDAISTADSSTHKKKTVDRYLTVAGKHYKHHFHFLQNSSII
jgi:hypothetical protein